MVLYRTYVCTYLFCLNQIWVKNMFFEQKKKKRILLFYFLLRLVYNAFMILYKTFVFRLYPTKRQLVQMDKTLKICCSLYNRTLKAKNESWKTEKKRLYKFGTQKLLTQWKKNDVELKEPYSACLQEVHGRIETAFEGFFLRAKRGNCAVGLLTVD